jgi:hypothetical protein
MTQLILKRAPVGDNQEDYSVLEDGAVVGRIFFLDAVGPQGRPWMVGQRPQWRLPTPGAWLRADAGGGDAGVRPELAGGVARCHGFVRTSVHAHARRRDDVLRGRHFHPLTTKKKAPRAIARGKYRIIEGVWDHPQTAQTYVGSLSHRQ